MDATIWAIPFLGLGWVLIASSAVLIAGGINKNVRQED